MGIPTAAHKLVYELATECFQLYVWYLSSESRDHVHGHDRGALARDTKVKLQEIQTKVQQVRMKFKAIST
jgi:hypothetical protein